MNWLDVVHVSKRRPGRQFMRMLPAAEKTTNRMAVVAGRIDNEYAARPAAAAAIWLGLLHAAAHLEWPVRRDVARRARRSSNRRFARGTRSPTQVKSYLAATRHRVAGELSVASGTIVFNATR